LPAAPRDDGSMLHDKVRSLAEGANFAAFTTLLPDGQPQTHIMWVGVDGEHLVINTEVHRRKFKNVEADPRVTVTIWDAENPYSFVEVRGRVVESVTGDEARSSIDALSQTYMGRDYANEIQSERVILRIEPDRQVIH
jgi:PPOX class probable F420-dependent enzyme